MKLKKKQIKNLKNLLLKKYRLNIKEKKVGKKEDNLNGLPVTTIEYFLSDEEAKCPKCSNSRHIMGKNIRKEFERLGVDLSRQTMANWVIRCSDDWLSPIYDLMKDKLLKNDILHADETQLQVLKETGKPAKSKSYMWLYRTSGASKNSIVLYEYQPDRAYKTIEFLKGFKDFLHG